MNDDMMHFLRTAISFATVASVVLFSGLASAANCVLQPANEEALAPLLKGKGVLLGTSPWAIVFKSGLERDEDGSPRAYHRGKAVASEVDDGVDPICDGGDVLELIDGKLINRYGSKGKYGSTSGIDPESGKKRALLCKE